MEQEAQGQLFSPGLCRQRRETEVVQAGKPGVPRTGHHSSSKLLGVAKRGDGVAQSGMEKGSGQPDYHHLLVTLSADQSSSWEPCKGRHPLCASGWSVSVVLACQGGP